jgi:hypothetical protein
MNSQFLSGRASVFGAARRPHLILERVQRGRATPANGLLYSGDKTCADALFVKNFTIIYGTR